MAKANYTCKDCRYIWTTKKNIGRPSACPRCNSKKVVWSNTNNHYVKFMGIAGILFFILSLFKPEIIPLTYGVLALIIGLFFLGFAFLISRVAKEEDKKVLSSNK
jgi:uncharacterized membrane protein